MPAPTSGNLCAVDGCKSSKRRDNHLSFFHLPADQKTRKAWIELIGRPDLGSPDKKIKSYVVCSLHFDENVITYIPKLRPNALPTKFIPLPEPTTSNSTTETKTKEISTQTLSLYASVCESDPHLVKRESDSHLVNCESDSHLVNCESDSHLVNCDSDSHLVNCESDSHLVKRESNLLLVNCESDSLLVNCESDSYFVKCESDL